ncbi:unnamed protein product, partial [Durusdinium trenchii]
AGCSARQGRRRVGRRLALRWPVPLGQEARLWCLHLARWILVHGPMGFKRHQWLWTLRGQGWPRVPGLVARSGDPWLWAIHLARRPKVPGPICRGSKAWLRHLHLAGRPPLRWFLGEGEADNQQSRWLGPERGTVAPWAIPAGVISDRGGLKVTLWSRDGLVKIDLNQKSAHFHPEKLEKTAQCG